MTDTKSAYGYGKFILASGVVIFAITDFVFGISSLHVWLLSIGRRRRLILTAAHG